MADRRGSRFVLEVLFLVALAVGLTLAHLTPLEIVGAMALGWVIMAALEWAAWRSEPHYGSGLPPRYYVPRTSLPPAQPLEQVPQGYPEQRDEAPTWIAPAALRAEVLGEWPHAAPVDEAEPVEAWPVPAGEETGDEADAVGVVPLPPVTQEPEPVAAVEPEPEAAVEPESEAEPVEAVEPEPEMEAPPEPADAGDDDRVALPEPVAAENGTVAHDQPLDVVLTRSARGVARHSLDPLAEPAPRRRFGRRRGDDAPAVEVPARPAGVRALPGRSTRQD